MMIYNSHILLSNSLVDDPNVPQPSEADVNERLLNKLTLFIAMDDDLDGSVFLPELEEPIQLLVQCIQKEVIIIDMAVNPLVFSFTAPLACELRRQYRRRENNDSLS